MTTTQATGDKLHPNALRTSLPALKQVARRLIETMQAKGSLAHMEEMREIVGKVDSRYRKQGKLHELVNYLVRTGSLLVDPGKNGRLFFDDERASVIDDARVRGVYAPPAEAAATRIAALKRRFEEHQRKIEAVHVPTPPPPAPASAPTSEEEAVADPTPAPTPPKAEASSVRTRRVRKRAKLEPSPGADKVLYLTPDEEVRWESEPWFENPARYFVIQIEKRDTCPVPTRLGELIAHIEANGFEVRGKELVRDAFARVSAQVDPDRALNPATSYLKVAGYRSDYPTNGWGVIFLWQKGARILTGVKGYGRFTYVSMDQPPKRQRRLPAEPVQEARRPTPPPPPTPPAVPAPEPYSAEAIAQLGDTELYAVFARTRQEIGARFDRRQVELDARGKRIAQDLATHTFEGEKLKKERDALLGDLSGAKALSN